MASQSSVITFKPQILSKLEKIDEDEDNKMPIEDAISFNNDIIFE